MNAKLSNFAGPPKVDGSYIAVGEVVTISDDERGQLKFDETFDSESGNAAFISYEAGTNISFIEDALVNQTFRYFEDTCEVITVEEWIEVPVPPSLAGYTNSNGKVRFSLKQLFDISDKYLVPEEAGKAVTYRDLEAVSWMYRIPSVLETENKSIVDIYAFWSNETWTTTSGQGQVPLGYKITRLIHIENNTQPMLHSEQYLSVFSFIHNAVNRKALEPRTGIYCGNRNSSYDFPVLSQAEAISFKSEIIFPDSWEIKTMDVWYDTKNGFLRVDMDRLDDQKSTFKARRYSSIITSKNIGTTYFFDVFQGKVSCKAINTENYKTDLQEIINPKLDLWSIDSLFSHNSTHWTYIGKTTKRNIPCHLFQGIRKDWPDVESNMGSLWEFCVVANLSSETTMVNFRDGEIGLISLQIKFAQKTPILSENKVATIIHHFYDVIEEDAANLDVMTFDISKCFQPNEQRRLEFAVAVDSKYMEAVESATFDVRFLGAWKNAISDKSKLPLRTLRVAKVQSMVLYDTLFISFTILDVHPDLRMNPKQKHPTLEEAIHFLNTSINDGELKISYPLTKDQKEVTLNALKNSMNDIIKKPDKIPTLPPIPRTSPTEETDSPIVITTSKSFSDGGDETTSSGGITSSDKTTPDGKSTSSDKTTPDGKSTSSDKTTPDSKSTSSDKTTPDGKSTSDSGDKRSTENPEGTKSPLVRSVITGHGSGTVAGVSIAMLLIGLTMGVGGTFYKYRGIPGFR